MKNISTPIHAVENKVHIEPNLLFIDLLELGVYAFVPC